MNNLFCCGLIPVPYGDWEGKWFEHKLCHSCRFACQHRVLKIFLGPDYLHSEDIVV